jgi:Zn-dependent M28 family amino/carboxypeptidase
MASSLLVSLSTKHDMLVKLIPSAGADDNASGVVVLLETLRAVLRSGLRPERTTEIHWYAAEEAGYLGSAALVADYRSKDHKVLGMACVSYTLVSDSRAWADNACSMTP